MSIDCTSRLNLALELNGERDRFDPARRSLSVDGMFCITAVNGKSRMAQLLHEWALAGNGDRHEERGVVDSEDRVGLFA